MHFGNGDKPNVHQFKIFKSKFYYTDMTWDRLLWRNTRRDRIPTHIWLKRRHQRPLSRCVQPGSVWSAWD